MPDVARPLDGVRVFDLTHVWSGPMATRLLASLGAEVIKIENPARPDILRGSRQDLRLRYPDGEYGEDPLNRNAWFNTQNIDKRSVALDLKSQEGLHAALDIVRECDVVMSNYRAGVLSRMGLGYERLQDLNPRIVVVEMTAFPSNSRQAKAAGFGAQFDAASGNAWLSGDAAGPILTGFAIGDPVGGMFAASAVVTALFRRRRTGRGCHVEIPQSESMMPIFGEAFVAEARGLASRVRLNGDPDAAPHGIFRGAGGSWLAIGIHDDAQWQALAERMADDGHRVPPQWASADQRLVEVEAVEEAVRTWVSCADDVDRLQEDLQRCGVPAGVVAGPAELSRDEHLTSAGYFTELSHPSAGTHPYPGLPWRLEGLRLDPKAPAPLLGQHTAAYVQPKSRDAAHVATA